ncbi:MAG: ParB/RepB/Spo0J family partition protein, partial [Candidatus Asgardarchaeia archaeon]
VRPKGDHYQLICGHNRLKAAKKFGIPKLPAKIVQMNDTEALLAATTENIMRTEQDPIKEAELYKTLKEKHGLTVKQIAEKFGKSETYVYARIRTLDLPQPIQQMIQTKQLNPTTALELHRIPTPEEQIMIASDLARSNATQRQAKLLVDSYIQAKKQLQDAPKEEVLEEAKKTPVGRCDICKEMKELPMLKSYIICDDCYQHLMFLLESERRQQQKT